MNLDDMKLGDMKLEDKQPQKSVEDKMNDPFLSQLLGYKAQLIDQDFIDRLMFRVKRFERIRYVIIAICALLGVFSLSRVSLKGITSFEHLSLPDMAQFSLLNQLSESATKLPVESFTAIILGSMLTLAVWLFITD